MEKKSMACDQGVRLPLLAALPSFLSEEECRLIRDFCDELHCIPGAVFQVKRAGEDDLMAVRELSDVRRAETAKIELFDQTKWIYEKIFSAVLSFNKNLWNFEISASETIEYLSYTEGCYFDWHYDVAEYGPATHRKLVVVIQLSDFDEYEGGDLEIFSGRDKVMAPKEKGSLIIFPSYAFHKVHIIQKGWRQALICSIMSERPFR